MLQKPQQSPRLDGTRLTGIKALHQEEEKHTFAH
jgi:hypothetical protein